MRPFNAGTIGQMQHADKPSRSLISLRWFMKVELRMLACSKWTIAAFYERKPVRPDKAAPNSHQRHMGCDDAGAVSVAELARILMLLHQ